MDTEQLLAGYLVVARDVRADWQDVGLRGADVISMSECVVDLVPANRDGWDDWFDDPVSAERSRAHADRSGLHVLAVGIAATDAPALLREMADAGYGPDAGGVAGRLARREAFPDVRSGRVLGFEPVGFDTGGWHTWTCLGGLVAEVRQATGVRPGSWGLIQDEQEARRAAEWLTASGLGDPKVFSWVPALLVDVTGRGSSARPE
ncbi:hypothetical protein SAMN05216188_104352 [Lentzea xinjiangensis]|uniref:Uncharacterized protein n=1 Tax=Lentzea xinjiangensis TaxID=402600 RepID=A0A1H9I588_9PSEU|nr:hypothetical protein [Lentzea xinjiangensis]SEQ69717.1 hypothetical protein SAMN05216188_104352 [Lentzea xinjiangensis]